MNRRELIRVAGGAAFAPLAARLLRAAPDGCPPLICPPKSWGKGCTGVSKGPAFCKRARFTSIPAEGEEWVEFSPPPCSKPHPRLLWSELSRRRNWIMARRVKDDLKRAYDKLLLKYDDYDKRSLQYQAWIHQFYCHGTAKQASVHTTWDFLPWHRAFLYFHERILADACGNADFRLPVWDWENDIYLPEFYDKLGLPSFLTGGYGRVLQPNPCETSPPVLQAWLSSVNFRCFCGGPTDCPRAFAGPHAAVHGVVVAGAMSNFATAAADPCFYAHHASVDRFWRFWLNHYKGYKRPGHWLNRSYFLYDERQQLVRIRTWQLLDECRLGYTYATDPAVHLPEFQIFPVTGDVWARPFSLLSTVIELMLGTLCLRGATDETLLEVGKNVAAGNGDSRLPSLPTRIRCQFPTDEFVDGQSYQLYIDGKREPIKKPATLGDFSFFGHDTDACKDTLIISKIDSEFVGGLSRILGSRDQPALGLNGPEVLRRTVAFGEISGFEILYAPTALDIGKRKIQQLGLSF